MGDKPVEKDTMDADTASKDLNSEVQEKNALSQNSSFCLLALSPCALICNCFGSSEESSEKQMSEDGMFYCSLCEVEVYEIIWNLFKFSSFLIIKFVFVLYIKFVFVLY